MQSKLTEHKKRLAGQWVLIMVMLFFVLICTCLS